MNPFNKLAADLRRFDAVQRDEQGWWLREFALANWARETVYPEAINRHVQEIIQHVKEAPHEY